MSEKPELFSMRQYAKHRGVSPEAVSKAVRTSRISVIDIGGKKFINPQIADLEWEKNTNAAMKRGESDQPNDLNKSKAIKEDYLARLAQLEFEEKSSKVHDVEECGSKLFKLGRMVRDAMMNIPDRVAAELAAETNQFSVHKRLTDEIRKALSTLGEEGEL